MNTNRTKPDASQLPDGTREEKLANRPADPPATRASLRVVPSTRDEANELVARFHRHHPRVPGHRFALALEMDGELVGAAIVARPVSRHLDADRFTAEVVRLVVRDGVKNGCSKLYRAAWRAWHEMGGRRLVTYTLPEEGGASLRGAGARFMGEAGGGSWNRKGRPRQDKAPLGIKHLWEWTA